MFLFKTGIAGNANTQANQGQQASNPIPDLIAGAAAALGIPVPSPVSIPGFSF
jgi:hypothetical protein